ncbi:hypothetical protein L484_021502 [Morus notabilis]|uniref:Uncharacterized protein n=1 Tax=Morus notabilis TaxID=981085 RepID=W9SK49_9ROSA|nr:hypothetical protein L484_021502 [Morus notabilis]
MPDLTSGGDYKRDIKEAFFWRRVSFGKASVVYGDGRHWRMRIPHCVSISGYVACLSKPSFFPHDPLADRAIIECL